MIMPDYLFNILKGGVLRNVRKSTAQNMARAFACVVQFVPHISKHHTIRFMCRKLPPEFCTNEFSSENW
jgi:hypothetical protein